MARQGARGGGRPAPSRGRANEDGRERWSQALRGALSERQTSPRRGAYGGHTASRNAAGSQSAIISARHSTRIGGLAHSGGLFEQVRKGALVDVGRGMDLHVMHVLARALEQTHWRRASAYVRRTRSRIVRSPFI